MATRANVDELLDRLRKVRRTGAGWTALCAAHDDREPSLSISEGDDGLILLYCHAGCPTESVLRALDMTFRDLFPRRR
jgi:putative DNA primase/helicase